MRPRDLPQPGDRVRSLYRARWTGTVLSVERFNDGRAVASVRQELDRCGRPMRLRRVVQLHVSYLERVA